MHTTSSIVSVIDHDSQKWYVSTVAQLKSTIRPLLKLPSSLCARTIRIFLLIPHFQHVRTGWTKCPSPSSDNSGNNCASANITTSNRQFAIPTQWEYVACLCSQYNWVSQLSLEKPVLKTIILHPYNINFLCTLRCQHLQFFVNPLHSPWSHSIPLINVRGSSQIHCTPVCSSRQHWFPMQQLNTLKCAQTSVWGLTHVLSNSSSAYILSHIQLKHVHKSH